MIFVVRRSALPGFAPTLGVTLLWLSLIVLVPLASLALRPWELGIIGVWHSITEPRVLAALRLSFGSAITAAAVNVPLGLLIAWVMVRYRFPGRGFADSLIDMPLALPTAVAGIALSALFAPNGWIGALLAGFGAALARGVGEYGSVIFIAGNLPMVSEIVPLLIVTKLEQYDYGGAAALAVAMLVLSFVLLYGINRVQRWSRRWAPI